MAGNYPNLVSAAKGLYSNRGFSGFYSGWWPGLAGKIPSYALTWTFFQQLKRIRSAVTDDRPARNYENTIMGCIASGATVCIMIPMDTIKTRLVTQTNAALVTGTPYKGIVDCAVRVAREEGVSTFYRGLAPRLISVVPMIGIQFATYEYMKKLMLQRSNPPAPSSKSILAGKAVGPARAPRKGVTNGSEPWVDRYGPEECVKEAAMEVAASGSNSFPAPHFLKRLPKEEKIQGFRVFSSSPSSHSKSKLLR
jgi:Mitochondrial carrier protein